MKPIRFLDWRGRAVPSWVRFGALGLAISLVIALSHWLLVESGIAGRPRHDVHASELSGEHLVQSLHERWTGQSVHDSPPIVLHYELRAYGWPVANWGAIYRQLYVFNLRSGIRTVVGLDVSGLWAPATGGDPYQRVLPVFPMVGQTIINAGIWGGAIWFVSSAGRRWRNRRLGIIPCQRCGYNLAHVPTGSPCPECGASP